MTPPIANFFFFISKYFVTISDFKHLINFCIVNITIRLLNFGLKHVFGKFRLENFTPDSTVPQIPIKCEKQ